MYKSIGTIQKQVGTRHDKRGRSKQHSNDTQLPLGYLTRFFSLSIDLFARRRRCHDSPMLCGTFRCRVGSSTGKTTDRKIVGSAISLGTLSAPLFGPASPSPLPVCTFTWKQGDEIVNKLYKALLPALGVNRQFGGWH